MNKNQEMAVGTRLRYKGKQSADFNYDHADITFLGYDSNGFYGIWVEHLGEQKFLNIHDVELAE